MLKSWRLAAAWVCGVGFVAAWAFSIYFAERARRHVRPGVRLGWLARPRRSQLTEVGRRYVRRQVWALLAVVVLGLLTVALGRDTGR